MQISVLGNFLNRVVMIRLRLCKKSNHS